MTDFLNHKNEICSLAEHVFFDEPMKKRTTFRIGGPADIFVEAQNTDEIIAVVNYCKSHNIPFMIMGNGSNMLVSDKGIRGVVIQVGKRMNEVKIDGETVDAQAGIMMSSLSSIILKAGLSGFEELSGIPGTLGGGIYMNAGAYGGELKNVIVSVTYIDRAGNIKTSPCSELDFSYRHSMFEEGGYVILSCILKLHKGNAEEIAAKMQDYTNRRNEKQPISMPSAGSTFKRPEGFFAGKLIQDSGLKGFSIGGAQVSEKHSGFIINTGNASACDVLALIKHVQDTVFCKFGVKLEPEVRLIGEK